MYSIISDGLLKRMYPLSTKGMGTWLPLSNIEENGVLRLNESMAAKTEKNMIKRAELKINTFCSSSLLPAERGIITFRNPLTQKKVNAPAKRVNVSYWPIFVCPKSDFENRIPMRNSEPYLISWKS